MVNSRFYIASVKESLIFRKMAKQPSQPQSWSKASSSFLALQLRLFSVIQLAVGAAFIALACLLIWPSTRNALTVVMWLVGLVTLVAALLGFFAAISPYLTLTLISLLMQSGFLLYIFIVPEKAINSVTGAWITGHPSDASPPTDKIHSGVFTGRWVLLGFFGLQILAVLIALCLRCCAKRSNHYEAFHDEHTMYQARQTDTETKMAKLRAEVTASGTMPPLKKKGVALTELVSGGTPSHLGDPDSIAPYRPTNTMRNGGERERDLEAGSREVAGASSARPPLPPPSRYEKRKESMKRYILRTLMSRLMTFYCFTIVLMQIWK